MGGPRGDARTLGRDFKDVRRHVSTAGSGPGFNGWVGLGVGFALGLGIAGGVHYWDKHEQVAAVPVPTPATEPASEIASEDVVVGAPEAAPGPEFDFYDLLPRQEVEVPAKSARTAAGTAVRTPLPTGDVVLQAGSFKQPTEAERMIADLALLGIQARVQRASVDDETWYRVRIGPISTAEELQVTQARLREAEINATVVTRVDEVPPLP